MYLIKFSIISLLFTLTSIADDVYPEVTVTIDMNNNLEDSYSYIVPFELNHIIKETGMLSGVDSTSNKEIWFKPGSSRTIYFHDGNTAFETLLTVEQNKGFSYVVEDFSSILRLFAKRVEGSWVFTENKDGTVHIEWTYKLISKSWFARRVLNNFVMNDVEQMLNNALLIIKDDLEK